MGSYYNLWITALTDAYEPFITSNLIKAGLEVGSCSISPDDNTSNSSKIIYYQLICPKGSDLSIVTELIFQAVNKTKAYYYSIIIAFASEANYYHSNISFPYKPSKPNVLN